MLVLMCLFPQFWKLYELRNDSISAVLVGLSFLCERPVLMRTLNLNFVQNDVFQRNSYGGDTEGYCITDGNPLVLTSETTLGIVTRKPERSTGDDGSTLDSNPQ